MIPGVVRLGVVQGEYHWHQHDSEGEFFYVVEGRFLNGPAHGGTRHDRPYRILTRDGADPPC